MDRVQLLISQAEIEHGQALKTIERCERTLASQSPQKLIKLIPQVEDVVQNFLQSINAAEDEFVKLNRNRPASISDKMLRTLRENIKSLKPHLEEVNKRLARLRKECYQSSDSIEAAINEALHETNPPQQGFQLKQESWEETQQRMQLQVIFWINLSSLPVLFSVLLVFPLQANTQDINSIFRNMASDIQEQGERLLNIEDNLQTTYERVEDGLHELQEAHAYQLMSDFAIDLFAFSTCHVNFQSMLILFMFDLSQPAFKGLHTS
eukprot:gene1114-4342_t